MDMETHFPRNMISSSKGREDEKGMGACDDSSKQTGTQVAGSCAWGEEGTDP